MSGMLVNARHEILRDPSDRTGVALLAGAGRTPIHSVDDLPTHAVEIHVFNDAALAAAFEAGLVLAGGNVVAVRRHADVDLDLSRHVLVARFDVERPVVASLEDAVRVIGHRASGEDGRIIARANVASMKRNEDELARRRESVRPFIAMLGEAGVRASYDGNTSRAVHIELTGPRTPLLAPRLALEPTGESSWRAVVRPCDLHDYFFERPLHRLLVELVEEHGWTVSEENDLENGPFETAEALGVVRSMETLGTALDAALLTVWRERKAVEEARETQRKKAARARRPSSNAGSAPRA